MLRGTATAAVWQTLPVKAKLFIFQARTDRSNRYRRRPIAFSTRPVADRPSSGSASAPARWGTPLPRDTLFIFRAAVSMPVRAQSPAGRTRPAGPAYALPSSTTIFDRTHMATAELSSTRFITHSVVSESSAQQSLGRLGAWQLIRQLGEGTFTRVYQARFADAHESQLASYAIKVLRNQWWRDLQVVEMQRREAWIGSVVSHPNLLPVLAASVEEPPFYIVSPKLEGATLDRLLAERGPLSVPLALWIARQVAEGLAALGDATGMIHTDVKPANILISPIGHATLIDFGFAQTPAESSRWATRPLQGTLAYIAPEMVTSALAADARSDVYSLGVTLYEMLTGRRPWESDDPGELASLHREAKPICIRELRPELPKPVASLVHSMLAKEPLRRPGRPRELAAKLVRLEIECFTLV